MQLSDFGSWGSRALAFGPRLSLPLFNGGRLEGSRVNLREAQQQEAALAYQQTVCAPGIRSTTN